MFFAGLFCFYFFPKRCLGGSAKIGVMAQTYSVRDICERYAVGEHTVLAWIKRGELKGIDVSRRLGGKPRWRITAEALAAFEQLRTPTPPMPPVKRNRRRADVVEFY